MRNIYGIFQKKSRTGLRKHIFLSRMFIFAQLADDKGRIKFEDIVGYFCAYYEGRRTSGLKVEKANSIFAKGGYTDKEAERNILANPFKRFEDMQMLRHTKTLGIIQVDEAVWKHLSKEEKADIDRICDEKLNVYFDRISE